MPNPMRSPTSSRGFVVGYVLIGLALLSLSLMLMSRMNMQGQTGKLMADTRDEVVNQASLIRAKLIACTVTYPGGDNGLGYRVQLPVTPSSGLVADLTCPGNPNTNNSLWTSADGVYSPRHLNGLSDWSYVNDPTSARISITASSGGAAMTAALNNAALRFGSQATFSGNTLTVTIAN